MLTIRLLHAIDNWYMLKMEIGACKNAKKKKKKKKKIKFHIFRFCPTFDMSYLNVYPHQKMQKTFVLQFVLG